MTPGGFPSASWVAPCLIVRTSPLQGLGLFALQPIPHGVVLIRWGGRLYSDAEVWAPDSPVRFESLGEVGDNVYLGQPHEVPPLPDERMNHSCDPNVWLVGTGVFESRRDISQGEEVCADYATFESHPTWSMPCACGAPSCRGVITGLQWASPEIRRAYGSHISPHLLARS